MVDCNLNILKSELNENLDKIKIKKLNLLESQKNIIGELNSDTLKKCKFKDKILLEDLIKLEIIYKKNNIKNILIKERNKIKEKNTETGTDINKKEMLHKIEINYINEMYTKEIKENKTKLDIYNNFIKKREYNIETYEKNSNQLNKNIKLLETNIMNLHSKLKMIKSNKETVLIKFNSKYNNISNSLKNKIKKKTKIYCCNENIDLKQFDKIHFINLIELDNNIFNEINENIKLKGGESIKCKEEKSRLKHELRYLQIYNNKITDLLNKCYRFHETKDVTIEELCYTNTQVREKIKNLKNSITIQENSIPEVDINKIINTKSNLSKYSQEIELWENEKINLKSEYTLELNEIKNKLDIYINIYGSEKNLDNKLNNLINKHIKHISILNKRYLILKELENKIKNIIEIQQDNIEYINSNGLLLIKEKIDKNKDILKKIEDCPKCI